MRTRNKDYSLTARYPARTGTPVHAATDDHAKPATTLNSPLPFAKFTLPLVSWNVRTLFKHASNELLPHLELLLARVLLEVVEDPEHVREPQRLHL